MAKNLYNLTAVTTVNDSDLLHVNQGSVSSDKKVTKQNLLKEVNSSITSINNSLTQLLKIGIFSKSSPATNIPAGSPGSFSVPITVPSGYTLVGIVEYSGSGTSGFSYSDMYRAGNNITIYYRNNNTETRSISSFSVTVLFVKTGYISNA